MHRWFAGAVAAAVAALAASAGLASTHAGGVTIKVADKGTTYVINQSSTDHMGYAPGTVTVKSGSMLTFTYAGKPTMDPHTLTIAAQKDLPSTAAQINACENGGDKVCNMITAEHIKNPKLPPGPTNDIAHFIVNAGPTGLDEPGDSVAIEGPKHNSVSIKVTAPAGTTLYFFCLVHPWMHGKITVT